MSAHKAEMVIAREFARSAVQSFYQAGDERPERESLRVQRSAIADDILVDEIVAGRWARSWVVTVVDVLDRHRVAQGVNRHVRQVAVPSGRGAR